MKEHIEALIAGADDRLMRMKRELEEQGAAASRVVDVLRENVKDLAELVERAPDRIAKGGGLIASGRVSVHQHDADRCDGRLTFGFNYPAVHMLPTSGKLERGVYRVLVIAERVDDVEG